MALLGPPSLLLLLLACLWNPTKCILRKGSILSWTLLWNAKIKPYTCMCSIFCISCFEHPDPCLSSPDWFPVWQMTYPGWGWWRRAGPALQQWPTWSWTRWTAEAAAGVASVSRARTTTSTWAWSSPTYRCSPTEVSLETDMLEQSCCELCSTWVMSRTIK